MDRHQKFERRDMRDFLFGECDFSLVDEFWQEMASDDKILEKMGDPKFARKVSQAANLLAGLLCRGVPSWSPDVMPFPLFGDEDLGSVLAGLVEDRDWRGRAG